MADIDLLFESALLLATLCFSLSVYVLAKAATNKLHISYAALTLAVSVWSLSFFVSGVLRLRVFDSVHLMSTLILAPLTMIFIDYLLRPEGLFFFWFKRFTFLLSIVFFPLVLFGWDSYPWIRDVTFFSPILIVVAVVFLFVSEAMGVARPRSSSYLDIRGKDILRTLKRRNFGIYIGGALVTLICVMDRVPWMGRTIPAIGNFLLATYFYFLKDAVIQQQYLTYRRLLGRMIANTVSAFVFAVLFLLITVWVKDNIYLFVLNAFLVSYAAVVSFDPIRSLVNMVFQRFFFKEVERIESLSKMMEREIAGAHSLDTITHATQDFCSQAMSYGIKSFYVLDEEGKHFNKTYDATEEGRLAKILSAVYPLVEYWQEQGNWKPVLLEEMEAEFDRATVSTKSESISLTLESLKKLESTIALPLIHEGAVLGFVTLDAEEPPDPWESSWGILPLLRSFFLAAGEALHELDTFARLRERDRLAVLGEMSAGLAHEIRNPLGAIKGAAQVLELKEGDPAKPFLEIIVEEVNRLNGVVAQFLDYSKPLQGEFSVHNLNDLLSDSIVRFRRQLQRQNYSTDLAIEFDPKQEVPAIFCQPALLGQIFTNLLENAGQALEGRADAKIQLRIDYEQQNLGDAVHVVEIEDNGLGIDPENLDKIFIPFYTTFRHGTGLGLAVCQRIAKAHGGRLDVSSNLGEGTRFVLKLATKAGG